jgi:putative transcriptional regulator
LIKPLTMKNTIRIERAVMNITQQYLAEKIGVSRQTINAIESNKYVPSTVLALKMARLFKKNVDELFLLEETD